MKSTCLPHSADRQAMQDSGFRGGNDAFVARLALNLLFPQAIKPTRRVPFSWSH